MNRKREADRVAAERAASERQAATQAIEGEAAGKRDEIRQLKRDAASLIPKVLDAMAAKGHPGIEEVQVYLKRSGLGRALGRERLARVGAYRVSQYAYRESSSRAAGTDYIRLLSDGGLSVGSRSHTLDEFVRQVLNHEGLGDDGLFLPFEPFSLAGLREFVAGLSRLAGP